ncbi:MAG: hypothetical protein ABIU95_11450 [Burkholderiales bacterium]
MTHAFVVSALAHVLVIALITGAPPATRVASSERTITVLAPIAPLGAPRPPEIVPRAIESPRPVAAARVPVLAPAASTAVPPAAPPRASAASDRAILTVPQYRMALAFAAHRVGVAALDPLAPIDAARLTLLVAFNASGELDDIRLVGGEPDATVAVRAIELARRGVLAQPVPVALRGQAFSVELTIVATH